MKTYEKFDELAKYMKYMTSGRPANRSLTSNIQKRKKQNRQ